MPWDIMEESSERIAKIRDIEKELQDSPLGLESEKWMNLGDLLNSKWGYNPWSSQEMDEILLYGYKKPQEREVVINEKKVHQYLFSYEGFLGFFVRYNDIRKWEELYNQLQELKNAS
jgi:hypothetical protein